ncbi:ubiquinone/menaquinone biosynthesis methyltransferase [Rubrobacter xylanophilus]|uniref:Ubiquinone/menaquinone biosynthesis methyltransferase n=1 Tax=Rubrobacter xylanophilus TaxID=49319 RepID=A0A510HK09_9ACTN|nr:class I SAM-dependent methyltransferase [Rubrobacter xylanophilus]BBL80361.1 ubiquinone/menaquinone biosynthesis methyltransferase [Rubrobacter xylanophilus]
MSRGAAPETERVRRIWDAHARNYDRGIRTVDRLLLRDGRRWVCSRASGEVLEVAVGTGLNLPLYPEDVRLTGVDISPAMLERARRRAAELGRAATLLEGDAQSLPFPDASFDTVVCTLSLCSIPDDHKAVAEMKRVLRPGGRLLLLDHIRSSSRPWLSLQRVLDPLFVRLAGDHLLRRPLEHVVSEGFRVELAERYAKGMVERISAIKED